eukprot:352672-Chlamydomonas_euryale.AAC.16
MRAYVQACVGAYVRVYAHACLHGACEPSGRPPTCDRLQANPWHHFLSSATAVPSPRPFAAAAPSRPRVRTCRQLGLLDCNRKELVEHVLLLLLLFLLALRGHRGGPMEWIQAEQTGHAGGTAAWPLCP